MTGQKKIQKATKTEVDTQSLKKEPQKAKQETTRDTIKVHNNTLTLIQMQQKTNKYLLRISHWDFVSMAVVSTAHIANYVLMAFPNFILQDAHPT